MTTTIVPRRHRRDNREAARNLEEHFGQLEAQVLAEQALTGAPPAAEAKVPWRDRERLPVARPVMTNPKGEIRWAVGHVGNRAGHHLFRLDLHARTFWCAYGRGVARGCVSMRDYVKMPARQAVLLRLIAEGETKRHAKLAASYEARKRKRKEKLGAALAAVAVGFLIVLAVLGPWRTAAALFLAGSPALAVYGRRRGPAPAKVARVDTRPVQLADPRPSADLIHQAFEASKLPGLIVETAPHRVGSGWETVARFPIGEHTFRDAVKAHAKIAGNLGIGSECLVLAPIKGHGGSEKHLRIWHTKVDPFAGDPPPHPFLDPKHGPVDLWNDGLPLGVDQRGSEIRIPLTDTPFVNLVGQPGAGKSFAFLDILTGIAPDPLWDLDCFAFKPSDDFSPAKALVKACGGTYRCGTSDADFKAFLDYLKATRSTTVKRNEALGRLPVDRRSKLKVERDVAADPAIVPPMRPRAVLADEIITALESKYGPQILAELEEGARTFRSQNIVFILGSQFADSKLYEDLQKLLGSRLCLSVARWQDSKGALGDRGHDPDIADASTIPLNAKGVAFVSGALDDPDLGQRGTAKFRFYGNDLRWVRDHINRCLATVRAGQGARVDLAKADPVDPFRCKVADLFKPGETALTCMELGQRLGLGEGNWAGRRFADQAREHGIEPQVDTGGVATGSRNATFVALDQLGEGA